MNVNEYLEKTRKELKIRDDMLSIRPAIECSDGFKVSVQASKTHYCRPRINHGPYSHVELGFPSEKVDEWMEWAETPESPTDTVYGWVPVEVVESVLEQHGGIKL
jgi:hypothetical protein